MSTRPSDPFYRHQSTQNMQDPLSSILSETDAPKKQSVASSECQTAVQNSITLPQPNGLESASNSTTSLALRQLTASPTPSAESFDAFVQAADPRHPDHRLWVQRYSSVQRAPRPTTQKRSYPESRRRASLSAQLRPIDDNGSDADDPLDDPNGWENYTSGSARSHHSSSTTSTQQRRQALNARDKTKPKPRCPPLPPPRISSSINWQSEYGSPTIPESQETDTPPSYDHRSQQKTSNTHSSHVPIANEVTIAQDGHQVCYNRNARLEPDAAGLPLSSVHPSHDNLPSQSRADGRRLFKLPKPPRFGIRSKSARSENVHILPSPSSTQSFASQRIAHDREFGIPRKSFSQIRKILRSDSFRTPSQRAPEEEASRKSTSRDRLAGQNTFPRDDQPTLATQGTSGSVTQQPPPILSHLEHGTSSGDIDADQTLDLEAFPLRLDNEFRGTVNEFEMSDEDDEADNAIEAEEIRLPWVSTSFTPHVPLSTRAPSRPPVRTPNIVRRSLDSIVSPFRANLLAQPNRPSERDRAQQASNALAQKAAPSRRSMSEARFIRPWLPRPRQGSVTGQGRPLSVVCDQSDAELGDAPSALQIQPIVSHQTMKPGPLQPIFRNLPLANESGRALDPLSNSAGAKSSGAQRFPSWRRSQRASMDTTRAAPKIQGSKSIISRSTTQVNELDTETSLPAPNLPTSQARGRLTSFMDKFRSSTSSSRLPSPSFRQSIQASNSSQAGKARDLSTDPSSGRSSDLLKPLRSRSRSFASTRGRIFSTSHQDTEEPIPTIPDMPRSTSADRLTQEDEPWRRQLLTSAVSMSMNGVHAPPVLAASSSYDTTTRRPSQTSSVQTAHQNGDTLNIGRSSLSLGRLWRRRPTREDVDADQQVGELMTPDSIGAGTPRSSISSAREINTPNTDVAATSNDPVRLTIRKTLSPAIISDKPTSLGDASTFSAMRRSRSEPYAIDSDQEELTEMAADELAFRSPLGRFIRGNVGSDRLSRVEESSERQRKSVDTGTSQGRQLSSPRSLSSDARSFGEDRSVRRSTSADVRNPSTTTSPALGETQMFDRLRNYSMDVSRTAFVPTISGHDQTFPQRSPTQTPASVRSQPSNIPQDANINGKFAPNSTGFSRGTRSSFSQDRDRAPVASPVSVPVTSSRNGVRQALHVLRGKGGSRIANKGKGVGRPDVIVLGLDNDEVDNNNVSSSRISDSSESRDDALRRFSAGVYGPSITAAANVPTKTSKDDVSIPPLHAMSTPLRVKTDLIRQTALLSASTSSNQNAGLGIGSMEHQDGTAVPNRIDGGEGSLMTSTTSEGTFSTLGAHTPDNQSHGLEVSHVQTTESSQQPAAMRAFDSMLGNFPQQEKVLLRDISARAMERKISTSSNDNLLSSITRRQEDGLLHVGNSRNNPQGNSSVASVASLD